MAPSLSSSGLHVTTIAEEFTRFAAIAPADGSRRHRGGVAGTENSPPERRTLCHRVRGISTRPLRFSRPLQICKRMKTIGLAGGFREVSRAGGSLSTSQKRCRTMILHQGLRVQRMLKSGASGILEQTPCDPRDAGLPAHEGRAHRADV
jgi:hypothetical protein